MKRFGLIAGLCMLLALAGCVVPPPHHDEGPRYDHPRGHRPPPPEHHPYWGPRWH